MPQTSDVSFFVSVMFAWGGQAIPPRTRQGSCVVLRANQPRRIKRALVRLAHGVSSCSPSPARRWFRGGSRKKGLLGVPTERSLFLCAPVGRFPGRRGVAGEDAPCGRFPGRLPPCRVLCIAVRRQVLVADRCSERLGQRKISIEIRSVASTKGIPPSKVSSTGAADVIPFPFFLNSATFPSAPTFAGPNKTSNAVCDRSARWLGSPLPT
jgi:hypothetical protein